MTLPSGDHTGLSAGPGPSPSETVCDFRLNPGKAPLPHEFVIDPELVLRESTGPAPGSRK